MNAPGRSPIPGDRLSVRSLLLALTVAAVWGTNPVAIHAGLEQFPPLGGAAIRFLMVVVPLIFFVPGPTVRPIGVASYGLLLGLGLGLNNIAMAGHISPGLASLLLQVQVVVTIGLELALDRRRPSRGQAIALLLCAAGVLLIVMTQNEAADVLGVVLMLAAATIWAVANMIIGRGRGGSAIAMMVWSSLFAAALLFLLSLSFEGLPRLAACVTRADGIGWSALFWQAFASSLFGYASWNFLLNRHSASRVAPFALLVPVFGMAASALFIGEPMGPAKIIAGALIVSGMGFALLRRPARKQAA